MTGKKTPHSAGRNRTMSIAGTRNPLRSDQPHIPNGTHASMPIRFTRANGGRIEFAQNVLDNFDRYTQRRIEMCEAGGVLLGRHILDSQDIIVDAGTEPMLGDQRSRMRFFRNKKLHQAVVDTAWSKSEGTCTYLGEWHTHPESRPTPSDVDWRNWFRKLRMDRFSNPLIFVIVGTQEIRAWEGFLKRRTTTITLLSRASDTPDALSRA
jgi:integrative and conjugative element protein (TIGR02256 family)